MTNSTSGNIQTNNSKTQINGDPTPIITVKTLGNGDISLTIKQPSNIQLSSSSEPPPYQSPLVKKKKKTVRVRPPVRPSGEVVRIIGNHEYKEYVIMINFFTCISLIIIAVLGLIPNYYGIVITMLLPGVIMIPLTVASILVTTEWGPEIDDYVRRDGVTERKISHYVPAWQVALLHLLTILMNCLVCYTWLQGLNNQLRFPINSGEILAIKLKSRGINYMIAALIQFSTTPVFYLMLLLRPMFQRFESHIASVLKHLQPRKNYRFFREKPPTSLPTGVLYFNVRDLSI